jgi:hypothetical protein
MNNHYLKVFIFILLGGIILAGYGGWCYYSPATHSGSSAQHNFWTTITLENAPVSQVMHSAVWTGSKMIIWGGWKNYETPLIIGDRIYYGTDVNTGGVYDPRLDAWTTITTTGAPISRQQHTAIWTGSSTQPGKMIIWGGWSGGETLDGGIYDPILDTWTIPATATQRLNHTAVWTGEKMIVWGGDIDNYTMYTNTGSMYDPVLDTWSNITTTNAPSGRYYHTAIWSGVEMIIWGGPGTDTGGRYKP